jgi:hypothetical protein
VRAKARPTLLELYPYVAPSDPRAVHIGDIPSSAQYAQATSSEGRDLNDGPLKLNGVHYREGFIAQPSAHPSEIVFNVPRDAEVLMGAVGIADSGDERSSARCEVVTDDVTVFSSPMLRHGYPPEEFTIALRGVKQLRFVCDDGGDGAESDLVAWVGLRFSIKK